VPIPFFHEATRRVAFPLRRRAAEREDKRPAESPDSEMNRQRADLAGLLHGARCTMRGSVSAFRRGLGHWVVIQKVQTIGHETFGRPRSSVALGPGFSIRIFLSALPPRHHVRWLVQILNGRWGRITTGQHRRDLREFVGMVFCAPWRRLAPTGCSNNPPTPKTAKARGTLFYRLAQQAVQVEPAPFHTLTNHNP